MKALNTIMCAAMLMATSSIKAQTSYIYDGEDKALPITVSVGYVNKAWVTDFKDGYDYSENLWGEEGKRLHGVQVGLGYEPHTRIGLGMRTGLYYEVYISLSDEVKRQYGYDDYTEHSLYLPLHAMWKIPMGPAALTVYGGFGFNWAMFGTFSDDRYVYDYWDGWINVGDQWDTHKYGRNGWPKSFNTSYEFGASLQVKCFNFSVTYSDGITNHSFYSMDGPYKTKQQKLGISIGITTPL